MLATLASSVYLVLVYSARPRLCPYDLSTGCSRFLKCLRLGLMSRGRWTVRPRRERVHVQEELPSVQTAPGQRVQRVVHRRCPGADCPGSVSTDKWGCRVSTAVVLCPVQLFGQRCPGSVFRRSCPGGRPRPCPATQVTVVHVDCPATPGACPCPR